MKPAKTEVRRPARRSSPLARFLERHSLLLAICFIVIGCARLVATYSVLSVTVDEPGHLAMGVEYLATHTYRLETEHPPLARVMAALGPYFLEGARPAPNPSRTAEGDVIIGRTPNPNRTIFLMRLGMLPFFVLAGLVVYFWSCRYFGGVVAVLATGIFTSMPQILADGGLATTDMPLAASLGAAFLTGLWWVENPTGGRSVLFGATAGLAVLTKYTSLVYFPAVAGTGLILVWATQRPRLAVVRPFLLERGRSAVWAVLTCGLVIWAGFLFSFGPFPGWTVSLPAAEFFDGMAYVLGHNAEGHKSYLLGQLNQSGWWYYFPVALWVKTPIPILALSAVGLGICVRRLRENAYVFPVAFLLGVLLPAMMGHINIGIRHVLPIFIALSILAAMGALHLARWAQPGIGLALTIGLLCWFGLASARQHPDYLAYFNAFAGDKPEQWIVDSNLDWGQDLKRAAKRLRELGAREVSLFIFDGVGLERSRYLEEWYGMPAVRPLQAAVPRLGWNLVSPSKDKLDPVSPEIAAPGTAWYEQIEPQEKVGVLRLYYVTPDLVTRIEQAARSRLNTVIERLPK
jgi:hypothetical protein